MRATPRVHKIFLPTSLLPILFLFVDVVVLLLLLFFTLLTYTSYIHILYSTKQPATKNHQPIMPTDIRSFFGKATTTATGKRNHKNQPQQQQQQRATATAHVIRSKKTTSLSNTNNNNNNSGSPSRRRKSDDYLAKDQDDDDDIRNNAKRPNKRRVIADDDDDDDNDKKTKKEKILSKTIVLDDDVVDVDKERKHRNSNNSNKRKSPFFSNNEKKNSNNESHVEMSASDYFQRKQRPQTKPQPSQKAIPTRDRRGGDDQDTATTNEREDTEDDSSPPPVHKRPKRATDSASKRHTTRTTRATPTRSTIAGRTTKTRTTTIDLLGKEEDDDEEEENDNGDEDYQDGDDFEALQDDDDDFLLVVEQVEKKQQKQSTPTRRNSPRKSPSSVATAPLTQSSRSTVTKSSKTTTPLSKGKPQAKATKKKTTTTAGSRSSKSKTKSPAQPPRVSPLQPKFSLTEFDMEQPMAEQCLAGYTFVLTAVVEDQSATRDDVTDWIKMLGGRVTSAVSSRTDYLVVLGPNLEDGRPSTQGSKYAKASSLPNVQLVHGKAALFGLMKQYADLKNPNGCADQDDKKNEQTKHGGDESTATSSTASKKQHDMQPKKVVVNPYSKKITSNPYLKQAKPAAAATLTVQRMGDDGGDTRDPTMLWVDRYKPQSAQDVLGNQDSVRKLKAWLAKWEDLFNKDALVGKAFSNPQGPWKAALLSGPPGIGKTTTATLVAKESGREVVEYNASDVRSKKALHDSLGDITGSRSIQFSNSVKPPRPVKRCIIMDEVDGMGAGDRSGIAELIQMIKHSRVPIICICNDRQSQKLKSLVPYCLDLRYRRPTKSVIAQRAVQVGAQEGFTVELNAAEAIAESCGNDVRQVLNALQMWASSSEPEGERRIMTYRGLKERERSINKDEILRVSLFDAARLMMEGRKGLTGVTDPKEALGHFMHRNDAFFVDYSFTGLLVQQNYLKVMQGQFNAAKRNAATPNSSSLDEALDRMYKASESMSDYAHAEHKLRSEQNWSVLPFVASLVVKTGYHAGGETGGMLPGFPEFTTWLGRNSTKGKRVRLLSELNHHMNYNISGGTAELRLAYLPSLRGRFVSLLTAKGDGGMDAAIQLMDEYGLDRDDVLETMDEFRIDPKDKSFTQLLDSKKRSAFTRTYNTGTHKSQALVAEQGKAGTGKRSSAKASSAAGSSVDPDTIDDDDMEDEEEDEDEELDATKVAALFKTRGRGRKPAATGGTKKKGVAGKGGGGRRKKT